MVIEMSCSEFGPYFISILKSSLLYKYQTATELNGQCEPDCSETTPLSSYLPTADINEASGKAGAPIIISSRIRQRHKK